MSIKLSISGIRGQFHELMPHRVTKFAEAFSTYISGGDIIIGRDQRPSGKYIIEAVIAGLTYSGANVYDYGILPTPILHWVIRNSSFNGGISITAGHNSFDWNSMIFLNNEGSYLSHVEGEEFFNLCHSGDFDKRRFNQLGTYHADRLEHVNRYFKALELEVAPRRKLKFVIDCSNGFDSWVVERLSRSLQIHGVPIFCGEKGFLPKDPEPNIGNAGLLGTIVRETGSDGGFLLNSDASRVLVVDERGEPLSEELTLPIFAHIIQEEQQGIDIVTNYSTSKIIDKVAEKAGSKVYRTDVGQPYVVQMMKDIKAVIGGEGSGSIVYAPFSDGFDSFMFIKKIVEYMHTHKCSISDLAASFPIPDVYKETFFLKPSKIYTFLEKIGDLYKDKRKLKDGFFIEDGDQWLCIRASATVSMIRIVGEGKDMIDSLEEVKEMIE